MYEGVDEPAYVRRLRIAGLAVVGIALVALYFWVFTSVLKLDLPKTAILKKQLAHWESKVDVLDNRLSVYDRTLTGIEERNMKVYRSIYGLSDIPEGLQDFAFEGSRHYAWLDSLGANADLKRLVRRMDGIEKRTCLQSKALDEVKIIASQAGDMISCVPAVSPLSTRAGNFRLSSPFGGRTDPVRGGYEYHRGQDFAADKGTPVYSSGDGVVEKAEFKFTGYGNEVVIDHGYGYKTRYAHLSSIEVNEGMKVRRGERIGAVGRSGKSTGFHLHYEVIYRGNQVNPMNFMDVNMPWSEYEAMVKMRAEESPKDRKSSTSELLRRRDGR